MNGLDIFKQLSLKAGKYALFVAILAVVLNYWGIIALDGIPIPHFVDVLYGYVLLNSLVAGPFIFLERRGRQKVGLLCPKCKEPLEEIIDYACPKCGKLEFKPQKVGKN